MSALLSVEYFRKHVILVECTRTNVWLVSQEESEAWFNELLGSLEAERGMSVVIDLSQVECVGTAFVNTLYRLKNLIEGGDIQGSVRVWGAAPHVLSVLQIIQGISWDNDLSFRKICGTVLRASPDQRKEQRVAA